MPSAAEIKAARQAKMAAVMRKPPTPERLPFWERLGKHKPIKYSNPVKERLEFLESIRFQKNFTMFGPDAHIFSGIVGSCGKESSGGPSWGPTIQGRFAPAHEMFNEVRTKRILCS